MMKRAVPPLPPPMKKVVPPLLLVMVAWPAVVEAVKSSVALLIMVAPSAVLVSVAALPNLTVPLLVMVAFSAVLDSSKL
jgi:hypothetical protein